MSTKAPSTDDIKAVFVYPTLTKIVGEPTYASLERLQNECVQNARTQESRLGGGAHGLSGIAEFAPVYLLRTGFHFNRPNYPGDAPVYPPGATDLQWEQIKTVFLQNLKEWETIRCTETLLLGMIKKAVEEVWLAGIHDPAHGFGTRSLIDVLHHLFHIYGQIGPEEILKNQQELMALVDPAQPIAVVFQRIERCQKFATAGRIPFTPQQLLKAAETLVLATGKFSAAYHEWLAQPEVARTFVAF